MIEAVLPFACLPSSTGRDVWSERLMTPVEMEVPLVFAKESGNVRGASIVELPSKPTGWILDPQPTSGLTGLNSFHSWWGLSCVPIASVHPSGWLLVQACAAVPRMRLQQTGMRRRLKSAAAVDDFLLLWIHTLSLLESLNAGGTSMLALVNRPRK